MIVFDLATGATEPGVESAAGQAVALSRDGNLLAVREETDPFTFGAVAVHDLRSGEIVRMEGLCEFRDHTAPHPDCEFYPRTPFLGASNN